MRTSTAARVHQEVDGEQHAARHREQVVALTEEMEGLVLAESQGGFHLRVPEVRLEETIRRLEGIAPVVRSSRRAPEVSRVVRDLEIRVKNARALRARLEGLLDRADTVEEVLAVERELARVTEEVERLEAELSDEKGKVAFADVLLTVDDPASPGPVGWVFYGLYHGVKWLFVWD